MGQFGEKKSRNPLEDQHKGDPGPIKTEAADPH